MKADGEDLEHDVATVLGYMLLEYSKLDMELGLCLVWSDEGRYVDEVSRNVDPANFNGRLKRLQKLAKSKYAQAPAADAYVKWLSDAHEVRDLRNQLVHGRWGFLPQQGVVANVVGLPTAPEQTETRYSLAQLQESVRAIRVLRDRLSELRRMWPV